MATVHTRVWFAALAIAVPAEFILILLARNFDSPSFQTGAILTGVGIFGVLLAGPLAFSLLGSLWNRSDGDHFWRSTGIWRLQKKGFYVVLTNKSGYEEPIDDSEREFLPRSTVGPRESPIGPWETREKAEDGAIRFAASSEFYRIIIKKFRWAKEFPALDPQYWVVVHYREDIGRGRQERRPARCGPFESARNADQFACEKRKDVEVAQALVVGAKVVGIVTPFGSRSRESD